MKPKSVAHLTIIGRHASSIYIFQGEVIDCLVLRTWWSWTTTIVKYRSGIREGRTELETMATLCAVLLSSPGPAREEKRGGEETDTCRSLIPFNTCIQRSPRVRRDMKIHRGLTRYIFDGLLFSCTAISHAAHTRNNKQYRLPSFWFC